MDLERGNIFQVTGIFLIANKKKFFSISGDRKKKTRETFLIKNEICSKRGIEVSKILTKRKFFRSIERNDNYLTDFRRKDMKRI